MGGNFCVAGEFCTPQPPNKKWT